MQSREDMVTGATRADSTGSPAPSRWTWLAWPLGGVLTALPFLFDALEPLGLVSVLPWIWACERDPGKPFRKGYLGGFVFVFLGLSWLHHVSPVAVLLLALYFATSVALFATIVVRARHRLGMATWVVAPLAAWFGEAVSQHVTIFNVTWLFQGYTAWRWHPFVQAAEIGGISLVSAACVLVAGALHAAGTSVARRGFAGLRQREAWLPLAVAALVVVSFLAYGSARISSLDLREGPRVALVQGGVPQGERLDPRNADAIIDLHARLCITAAADVDLVVWPESTVNYPVEARPDVREKLGACARAAGAPVLTGGIGMNEGPPPSNSVFLFDASGRLVDRADKRVLVPGAETLLFLDRVDFIRKPVIEYLHRTMGFRPYLRPGDRPVVMTVGEWRFGSLTCYDDVVPLPADELQVAGAQALVTLSNEAWFGARELDQHLAMATLRCVETRLPMGRSTNTGLTCTIDPAGRVLEILPREEPGVLVAALPVASTWTVPPWIRRLADYTAIALGLSLLVATFVVPRRRKP